MSGAFPLVSGESNLEQRHPHIVKRLRQLWGQPEGSKYLAELMVDGRGGRAGFSREVFAELCRLAKDVPPLPLGLLKMTATSVLPAARSRVGFGEAHDLSRRRAAA